MTSETYRTHRGGWVTLDNSAVNDTQLSFRARGLLVYLLGRPPGWAFAAARIAAVSPREGREAILAALKELEQAGYIRRSRVRMAGGRVKTVTEVAALPELMPPPETGYPAPVEPEPVQPAPGNPSPKSVPEVVRTEVVKKDRARPVPTARPGLRPRRSTRAVLADQAQGVPATPEFLAAKAAVFGNRKRVT